MDIFGLHQMACVWILFTFSKKSRTFYDLFTASWINCDPHTTHLLVHAAVDPELCESLCHLVPAGQVYHLGLVSYTDTLCEGLCGKIETRLNQCSFLEK